MNENDLFSHFVITTDEAGSPLVVFRLHRPELRAETGPYGSTVYTEDFEIRFNEKSLEARIGNMRQQGLDASVSEAALRAIRQARTGEDLRAQHDVEAFSLIANLAAKALGSIAEITRDVVIVVTSKFGVAEPLISYVNPAFSCLAGYTPKEVIGRPLRMLYGASTSHDAAVALSSALLEAKGTEERILLHPKVGKPFWFNLRVATLPFQAGEQLIHSALVGHLADPAGRSPYEVESITQRDDLTGLFGQQAVLDAIATDLRKPRTARHRGPCIALVRIDNLDTVTARFGEQVGNAVLLGVADRLAANVRRADVVCRLGGPEFAVYMDSIGPQETDAGAARLHRMITLLPIETPVGPLPVTVSTGAAEALWQEDQEPQAILTTLLISARNILPHPKTAPLLVTAPQATEQDR